MVVVGLEADHRFSVDVQYGCYVRGPEIFFCRPIAASIRTRREVCMVGPFNFPSSNAATGASIRYMVTGTREKSTTCVIKHLTDDDNQVAKFLLLIAVFIIAYLVIQHSARRREAGEQRPQPKPGKSQPENMVRCGVCGIHLPRSESLASGGDYYCSEEHLRLARK